MQSTMQLLDKALEVESVPFWHKELGLSRNALHSARQRGNLSPSIAGAIAEKLGEDVDRWIVIAALESDKDSACKARMMRRYAGRRLYFSTQRRRVRYGASGRVSR